MIAPPAPTFDPPQEKPRFLWKVHTIQSSYFSPTIFAATLAAAWERRRWLRHLRVEPPSISIAGKEWRTDKATKCLEQGGDFTPWAGYFMLVNDWVSCTFGNLALAVRGLDTKG